MGRDYDTIIGRFRHWRYSNRKRGAARLPFWIWLKWTLFGERRA